MPVPASADNQPNVSLETSEALFTVLATINTCGYDQELSASDPLRAQVRTEIARAIQTTEGAPDVVAPLCQFYRAHSVGEPARDLAHYVSLALYLDDPPNFDLKAKGADLSPDAAAVQDVVPLMKAFYQKIGLHIIWDRHHTRYKELTEVYHEPLAKMTFDTEIYLKMPSAGYLGRSFTVYLDAMGAPSQTNARNYGPNYYVVISPSAGTGIKLQQIRHTYLHYLLDPLALKNGGAFQRLQPLLESVRDAPMDEAFKENISLLVTECLVRAIEIRSNDLRTSKAPEDDRAAEIGRDEKEGYILTRYFYEQLGKFANDPEGMRNAYPNLLGTIDVGKEKRRAAQTQFASEAAPELVRGARPRGDDLLLKAERRLAAGDAVTAKKLAQQALDLQQGNRQDNQPGNLQGNQQDRRQSDPQNDPENGAAQDAGRALFILAEVATADRDLDGARSYFEKALQAAHEPKLIAWSHIYLGRIYDLQEDRPAAVDQYHAALDAAGAALPEAKIAAQRGLDKAYEPPVAKRPD